MFDRLKSEFFPRADAFDLQRGVKTSGVRSLFWKRILSGRRDETVRYQPVAESCFQQAVQGLPRDWTFIDLGCGKGRALILAHEAGFRTIVGVEFSPALCRAARNNLAKLGIPATIECADATNYCVPPEPCVLYLYNPFGPRIISEVLKHMGTAPRMIVYVHPVHASSFQNLSVGASGDHFRVYLSNCGAESGLRGH